MRDFTQIETIDSVAASLRITRSTVLAICAVLVIAVGVLGNSVYRMQRQLATLERDSSESRNLMLKETAKMRDLAAIIGNSNRNTLKSIREEMEEAKHEAAVSAGQAKLEALMNVDRLAKELKIAQQREAQNRDQVSKQISDAHASASLAQARVSDVSTEVSTVKSQVNQAQQSISRAVSDLKRVIGDMGVMSGLVATNARELEYLRSLGDRNYTTFRLTKSKEPQAVAGIGLVLKRADPGSRKFTLEVIAEDVRVQKKDKTINEPVQFYVSNNKQPYEIVVNSVTRGSVDGYLATPKVPVEREATGGQ